MKRRVRVRHHQLNVALALLCLLLAWKPGRAFGETNRLAASAAFRRGFATPPAGSRMLKIIHSWPDEPPRQDELIRSLSRQGFGGVVCNVSFAQYLESDAKWKAFVRAVEAAKKAGLALWLYDEKGYPSGTAGGLVLRDRPEWEARGLLIAQTDVENGVAKLELPPGQPRLVAAFPVTNGTISLAQKTNLTAFVSAGKLSWPSPPGRWLVLAITESRLFEGTHASMSLSEHIPYPNLLEPEPIARFLEVTHQRYAAHLGTNLGRYFVSTFTDEPSLMSLFLRPMPYRVLPWSATLASSFRRQRGYSLEEKLPALVAEAGLETARVRYDYWNTVGQLVAQAYFGQIQDWCRRHHILSGGHLLMEENLVNQVPLYGDFFACLRRLDAPSIDCLTSLPEQVPWSIARLAGSAADLERKTITMCETSDHSQHYRPAGDNRPRRRVTPAEIRGTCNRLLVSGINTITSYYSFDGLTDEQLRELNDYIGRCCFALTGGHQVAGIAVLYPTESVWPRFTPSRHYANECAVAARIETVFRDVSDCLFATGRDFTYVDGRALGEAIVDRGVLRHGDLEWQVVILPAADTLPIKAWENLQRFVAAGGVLVAIGALPTNSETEFPSPQVQALTAKMFGPRANDSSEGITGGTTFPLGPRSLTNAAGGIGLALPADLAHLLPVALDSLLERDFKVAGGRSTLKYTHRHSDGQEIYFIINDSPGEWKGSVTLATVGPGERWNPATGEATPLANASQWPVELAPYGSSVFRFSKAYVPRRLQPGNHIVPTLVLKSLMPVAPTVARGEFVRETIEDVERNPTTPAARGPLAGVRPKWRVAGRLTQGKVDTFLFTRFVYPQGLDLQPFHSLALDSWVPVGQSSPTQLLVILHEKNGADYLAHSGRLLSAPGHQQTGIPWTRFELAGWSKDANSRLDLDQITEIRIGWGGYLGTEGEEIEFSLAAPQVTALASTAAARHAAE